MMLRSCESKSLVVLTLREVELSPATLIKLLSQSPALVNLTFQRIGQVLNFSQLRLSDPDAGAASLSDTKSEGPVLLRCSLRRLRTIRISESHVVCFAWLIACAPNCETIVLVQRPQFNLKY